MKKLLVFAMAALTIVACNKKEEQTNPEDSTKKVTLSESEISLEVGATHQLTANVAVTWSSSNDAVATVSDAGLVTAMKEGNAIIVAKNETSQASCLVKVAKAGGNQGGGTTQDYECLKGSNYFPIIMDATTYEKISDKVVADLRVDDAENYLYIWEGTMDAGQTQGKNFFNLTEGWVSLSVLNVGWSGWAINVQNTEKLSKLAEIMAAPAEYYMHIGFKSATKLSHRLFFDGTSGSGAYVIGGDFVDNGTPSNNRAMDADYNADGSWNEFEFPMTVLTQQGLVYGTAEKAVNIFGSLDGGISGTNVQYDAVFIYKK